MVPNMSNYKFTIRKLVNVVNIATVNMLYLMIFFAGNVCEMIERSEK